MVRARPSTSALVLSINIVICWTALTLNYVATAAPSRSTSTASAVGEGRAAEGFPTFRDEVVDPDNAGDCKAIADLDGDGDNDLVIGGRTLTWYEAPEWAPHQVANADEEFTTDCQAVDVDVDGGIDIVAPDGHSGMNLHWFRNPLSASGGSWDRHAIGEYGTYVHDVETGDLDGDQRIDVVTRSKDGPVVAWIHRGDGPWARHVLSNRSGEGTALGDVDGDDDLDVVVGGYWLENTPGTRGRWKEHRIRGGNSASIFVGDVDGDLVNDVFLGPNEASGEVAWYEKRNRHWRKHVIARDSGGNYHTFKAADIDLDGDLDLVTAVMGGTVAVHENRREGEEWRSHVISDTGLHNLRVGDLDGDGDVDIFGSNYLGNPPVRIWFNELRQSEH